MNRRTVAYARSDNGMPPERHSAVTRRTNFDVTLPSINTTYGMTRMRPFAAALLAVLLALPLSAQEKLVETIEVRVVNIDVVVTDRSGNAVHGLTQDDFEIFENGKPQKITNLYEVRSDSESLRVAGALEPSNAQKTNSAPANPPQEMRQRRVALFVDNYSLQQYQRNQILKSLVKFVDTVMRPGDEAALISWDKNLRVVIPFTTNHDDLKRAIAS